MFMFREHTKIIWNLTMIFVWHNDHRKSDYFSIPFKLTVPGIQKGPLSPIFNLIQHNQSNDSLPGNLEWNVLVPLLKIL